MPPTSERPPGPREAVAREAVANAAMDRYADGDASAFPVLYDALAPRIEGLVRRRTRDASRIDDIVQQTFERIHRARGTFIRGSDVLSWAFKIARNLCLDFGVQGWRERPAESKDADAAAEDLLRSGAAQFCTVRVRLLAVQRPEQPSMPRRQVPEPDFSPSRPKASTLATLR